MNKTYICKTKDSNNRLDYVLKNTFPELGGRGIKRLCEQEKIFINNRIAQASSKVKENDEITIINEEKKYEDILILYEDNAFIAVYKKPFLHTEKHVGSLDISLQENIEQIRDTTNYNYLTRLDYATSGIILIAKNTDIANNWKVLQNQNVIEKKYVALVEGIVDTTYSICSEIIAKNATTVQCVFTNSPNERKTYIEPIAVFQNENMSLISCTIFQGARHQIRAHCSHLGYPLVGDKKYGAKTSLDKITNFKYSIKNFVGNASMEIPQNNYTRTNSESFILHNYQIKSDIITVNCPIPFEKLFQN